MGRKSHEQLETRYVTGQRISLTELAEWGGVSHGTVFNLSRSGEWVRKRQEFLAQVTKKAATKRTERVAQDLEKFQGRAYELAAGLLERIAAHVEGGDPSSPMDPDTIRKLTGSLKEALQAGNLANGDATSIVKTIDERLKELEDELSDGLEGAV